MSDTYNNNINLSEKVHEILIGKLQVSQISISADENYQKNDFVRSDGLSHVPEKAAEDIFAEAKRSDPMDIVRVI